MKKLILLLCLGVSFLSKAQITVVTPGSGSSIYPCANFTIYFTSTQYVVNGVAEVWNGGSGGTKVATYTSGVYGGNVGTFTASNFPLGTNYQVKVYDAAIPSNFDWSDVFSVVAVPPAPIATAATSPGTTSFNANWTAVPGVTGYRLDVSTLADFSSFLSVYNNYQTSSNPTLVYIGAASGTTYYYRVRAEVNGCTSLSTSISSTVISTITLPSAPVLACASEITSTSFSINWPVVQGASEYWYQVSTSTSSWPYTPPTLFTASTSISLLNLSSNATYYVRVRAKNASGYSTTYSATQTVVLAAPHTTNAAAGIGATFFTATWPIYFGSKFVDVATDNSFAPGTLVGIYNNFQTYNPPTLLSISGVNPNTNYYYRVRLGTGTCGQTKSSNITPVLTLPSSPVALDATNVQGRSFTANWQPVVNINEYRLEVSANDFATLVLDITILNATSYAIPNNTVLAANTQYKYRVRSKNTTGYSSFSSVSPSVLTGTVPPTILLSTNILANSFTANWSPVFGSTSYQIDVSTNSSFTPSLTGFPIQVNGTLYTVTGLNPCATYYFRVLTINPTPSDYTPPTSQLTAPSAPVIPSPDWVTNHLAATNITANSFTANWLPDSGCPNINYYIDVATSNAFTTFVSSNFNNRSVVGTETSIAVPNLNAVSFPNNYPNFSYRVRTANSNGTQSSVSSNFLTVTLGNFTPTANLPDNVGSSAFIAKWSSVSGTIGYLLDVSISSTFTSYVYQNQFVNATQWSVTGLNSNTLYHYRVRGIITSGYSTYSNTRSLTTTLSGPPGGRIGQSSPAPESNDGLSKNTVNIFPNPATTSVWVSIPSGIDMSSIQPIIFDLFGRPFELPIKRSDNLLEIDISSLNRGVFLLSFSFGKSKFIGKIIKQ